MNDHLSDAQLAAFIGGTAAADELMKVDVHLESCASCRSRCAVLAGPQGAPDLLLDSLVPSSAHLTDDDLQDYVSSRLDAAKLTQMQQHLAECGVCAREASDLRAWLPAAAAPSRGWWVAAAAVLLLAILVPAGLRFVRSDARGADTVVGLNALSPVEQGRLRALLSSGPGPLPPALLELRSSTEVLLGQTPPPPRFALTAPVATVVETATPAFVWQPMQGATGYRVSVFDERAALIVRSPDVPEARWTPVQPLPRDRTLVWQVSATRGGEVVTEPSAPEPPARFRVVGEVLGARLSALERMQPDAHLVLGLLYRDTGIVGAARSHLLKVQPNDPYASLATQALRQLDPPGR